MNKRIISLILSSVLIACISLPQPAFANANEKGLLPEINDEQDINFSDEYEGKDYFGENQGNNDPVNSENNENSDNNDNNDNKDVPADPDPIVEYQKISVLSDGAVIREFEIENVEGNITYALRSAFDYCRENYENGKIYTVKIPKGEYNVGYALTVSSNTVLDLTEGVVLVDTYSNIFVSQIDVKGYNGTHDFTVRGGKLTYIDDSSDYNGCLVRLAHAKNIRFENTVFADNKNSHHIEIAACRNVTFEGCTFENMQADLSRTSGEALQIDILEENDHFKLMPEYDATMNDGITVNKCTFKNLLRGVGSQSAYAGLYQKNIKITNCTFDNIRATAISCMNFINSTISNNKITNCAEGITYYLMMSDANIKKMYYIDDKCTINTNCNSVISNNNITVVKNKVMPAASPIYVFGNNITADKGAKFKAGNYYVGNISITGNTINTPEYGIRIYDVKKSNISKNIINGVSKVNGTNGVYADADCDSNKINENKIKGFENGINIKNKSDSNTVSRNNISSSAKNGIILQSGVKSNMLSSNTITSASSNGIYSNGSKSTSITSNTISKSKSHGVCIMGKSQLTKLNSNKISSSTKNGVYMEAGSTITDFKSNSISKSSGNGASTYGSISNISSNTFTSNSWGIYIAQGVKSSIYKNTYKSNKKGACYCDGKKGYKFSNLSAPSVTVSRKSKTATVKWKKISNATSYQIYRATSKNAAYSKIATVNSKAVSYKNTKLSKGKTYYYKVRAIRKMNSTTLYSPYSSIKSIKIK